MEKFLSHTLLKQTNLFKDQILELTCRELSFEGLGTTRVNNYPILVNNFYPGEIAKVKIEQVYAKYAIGKIIDFIKYSSERSENQYTNIDAMPLVNLEYTKALKYKQIYLETLFKRNFEYFKLNTIIASQKVFNYRNKVKYPLKVVKNTLVLASYVKNTNDLNFDTANLILNNPNLNQSLKLILDYLNNYYFQNQKLAHLKFFKTILIRINELNDVQIGFELKTEYDLPKKLITKLLEIDKIIEIYVWKNFSYQKIASKKDFYLTLNNKSFKLNLNSFFQINNDVAKNIFDLVKEINDAKFTKLLDLFCGAGVISTLVAKESQEILGIDIVKEAIIDAKFNAKKNNLKHHFVAKDIFKENDVLKPFLDNSTLTIIDPPRSGLNTDLINLLGRNNILNLIYISCNPRTLVRDLKDFINNGYKVNYIQPFDMFPHTFHLELVCFITKEGNNE